MGMAGSLLPSHDARVLEPVTIGDITFKVDPVEAIETYVLRANGSLVAAHPNGFSLKELVTRIAVFHGCKTQERNFHHMRAEDQWDYILACGGMTRSKTTLAYYLGEAS